MYCEIVGNILKLNFGLSIWYKRITIKIPFVIVLHLEAPKKIPNFSLDQLAGRLNLGETIKTKLNELLS